MLIVNICFGRKIIFSGKWAITLQVNQQNDVNQSLCVCITILLLHANSIGQYLDMHSHEAKLRQLDLFWIKEKICCQIIPSSFDEF